MASEEKVTIVNERLLCNIDKKFVMLKSEDGKYWNFSFFIFLVQKTFPHLIFH